MITFFMTLFSLSNIVVVAQSTPSITGVIKDENGSTLADVKISIWNKTGLIDRIITSIDGSFKFNVEDKGNYIIYVLPDLKENRSFEYMPVRLEVTSAQKQLEITLYRVSSIILEGFMQFVDSDKLPTSVSYSILDPISGEILKIGELPLTFNSSDNSFNQFYNISRNTIPVPSNIPFVCI